MSWELVRQRKNGIRQAENSRGISEGVKEAITGPILPRGGAHLRLRRRVLHRQRIYQAWSIKRVAGKKEDGRGTASG